MKDRVIDIYGVKAAVKCRRVKYVLPWRRHGGTLGNKWGTAIVVLVCVAVSLLPIWIASFLKSAPGTFEKIVGTLWFLACNAFTCLFAFMAWSTWSHWGRAWIWISRSTIFSAQLRGDESLISITPIEQIKCFSTLPDGDDPNNPATPARLLAELDNNVKRIFGDYPVGLVDAMVRELTLTARRLRKLN